MVVVAVMCFLHMKISTRPMDLTCVAALAHWRDSPPEIPNWQRVFFLVGLLSAVIGVIHCCQFLRMDCRQRIGVAVRVQSFDFASGTLGRHAD